MAKSSGGDTGEDPPTMGILQTSKAVLKCNIEIQSYGLLSLRHTMASERLYISTPSDIISMACRVDTTYDG